MLQNGRNCETLPTVSSTNRRTSLFASISMAWRESAVSLRRLAVTLWTLGVLLGATGVLGDFRGWWSNTPFLTNLMSSLTGACIGIPIALFVLQQLSASQAIELENNRTARMIRELVRQLRANVDRVVPGLFSDFGFFHELQRKTDDACTVLRKILRQGSATAEDEENLRAVITENRAFDVMLDLSDCYSEARGLWSALRVPLLPATLDAVKSDKASILGTVDGHVDSVDRADISYYKVEGLWSNSKDEELTPGMLCLDSVGMERRIVTLTQLGSYLDALVKLYATLDGVTQMLQEEFDESPAQRESSEK